MTKPSFKATLQRVREDAIIASVNRLLAEKGYEQMTVDEVAADVGIAKASLYKHFSSKEALAAAAMVRLLEQALAFLQERAQDAVSSPLAKLQAATRWSMALQLAGQMPSLPSQNSELRAALGRNMHYLGLLSEVSDILGGWITQAQSEGLLDAGLPPEVVLYTVFARACDPVLGVMKSTGLYSDERILDLVMQTCFGGLQAR